MAVLQIPISKAGNQKIEIDTDALPLEVFSQAVYEGLKVYLNARMSKITTAKLEGDALETARAAAMAKAEENRTMLLAGKLTKTERGASAKAQGISREVQTEAMRLAKAIVKDEIRAAGMRPSMVAASDITAYAKQVLEGDPSIIEKAKENIANRAGIKPKIQLQFHESPKLVAKAEEKKAQTKGQLSKTQAGKPQVRVPPRQGPKPGREQHNLQ